MKSRHAKSIVEWCFPRLYRKLFLSVVWIKAAVQLGLFWYRSLRLKNSIVTLHSLHMFVYVSIR